jgi:uncharacterized protein
MVWRIEGHSLASKEYESKQQLIDEVLTPFGTRFAVSDPFRPVTIRSVYADGDTVIVLWDGCGVANDGKPYENSYAWVMKMHEGKVIDETAFYDSISFNDLWTRGVCQIHRFRHSALPMSARRDPRAGVSVEPNVAAAAAAGSLAV